MELEDLKQNWESASAQYTVSAYEVNMLLARKADDPLNVLKVKYMRQLFLLPAAAAILVLTSFTGPGLQYNAVLWMAVIILLFFTYNHYRNYKVVLRMLHVADQNIVSCLEKNLAILQENGRQHLQLNGLLLVAMIISFEFTLYLHLVPSYYVWQIALLPIRIAVYAILLMLQSVISKYLFNQNFGQYIGRLQELLDQAG